MSLAASGNSLHAATVAEFDAASQEHQGEFVAVTLQQIQRHYLSNPATHAKAECLADLYERNDASGTPSLMSIILNGLDAARNDDPHAHDVEDIVFGVTERECSISSQ